MKNNFLLFVILTFCLPAAGQTTDTTFLSITQENGPLEKQRFIDRYDYVFGTKQPTRLLVKLNLVPVVLPLGERLEEEYTIFRDILEKYDRTSKAELGVEWKVVPAWSLHAAGIIPTRGSDYFKGKYRGAGWRIEPRWYYDMPRRIRAEQQANNVSGNYISLDYQSFRERDEPPSSGANYQRYRFQTVSLRYGLQRRLLRYGFIDASIGAGYQDALYQYPTEFGNRTETDHGFFLETRVAAGFAFGGSRADKKEGGLCDVLRCFQEDRALWKINLVKILQMNRSGLSTNPKISYEHKIGNSSFSIETEGEVFLVSYRDFGERLYLQRYGAGLNVQPRWYFLQKRRIIKGKSGNNLNGVFAGIIGGYRRTNFPVRFFYSEDADNNFYLAPHVGIQQRLFRNGYINYKFGLLYNNVLANEYDGFRDPSSFLSELQVGFAF